MNSSEQDSDSSSSQRGAHLRYLIDLLLYCSRFSCSQLLFLPHLPDVLGEEVLAGASRCCVQGGDIVSKLLGPDHTGASVLGSTDLTIYC